MKLLNFLRRKKRPEIQFMVSQKTADEVQAETGATVNPECIGDVSTATEDDIVICMRLPDSKVFPDNIETVCAKCGAGIYHRPHVPKLAAKMCIRCAIDAIKGADDEQD